MFVKRKPFLNFVDDTVQDILFVFVSLHNGEIAQKGAVLEFQKLSTAFGKKKTNYYDGIQPMHRMHARTNTL